MNWTAILQMIQERATTVALQILGALVLYVIGRWLISLVVSAVQRALAKQQIEATVFRFVGNALSIALNVTLVVAILGYFGVQTTTFAALIAATALAVGTAWAGLLANFAAGAFLVVLRPFKVGDFISAGGIVGTVHEIGLFVTSFDTPDNVRTFVGNNKIFSDTIQNFTQNSFRRVDLIAQISGAADPQLAISRLKDRISTIPNVLKTPAPDVTSSGAAYIEAAGRVGEGERPEEEAGPFSPRADFASEASAPEVDNSFTPAPSVSEEVAADGSVADEKQDASEDATE